MGVGRSSKTQCVVRTPPFCLSCLFKGLCNMFLDCKWLLGTDDSSGSVTLAAGSKHKVIVTCTCTVDDPHAIAWETYMLVCLCSQLCPLSMLEYKRLLLPCEYVFTSTQSFLHVLLMSSSILNRSDLYTIDMYIVSTEVVPHLCLCNNNALRTLWHLIHILRFRFSTNMYCPWARKWSNSGERTISLPLIMSWTVLWPNFCF